jgi:hypothetical protein
MTMNEREAAASHGPQVVGVATQFLAACWPSEQAPA